MNQLSAKVLSFSLPKQLFSHLFPQDFLVNLQNPVIFDAAEIQETPFIAKAKNY